MEDIQEKIEFMKMQVEHANTVSGWMVGIAGVITAIALFVVTYQFVLNAWSLRRIKKTEELAISNLKIILRVQIRGQQQMGSLDYPVSEILNTAEYIKEKFSSDKEMKKLLSFYREFTITQWIRLFNPTFNNHDEKTKEAWEYTLNKEYSAWVNSYNIEIKKEDEEVPFGRFSGVEFTHLKNIDDAERQLNNIRLMIETFYK